MCGISVRSGISDRHSKQSIPKKGRKDPLSEVLGEMRLPAMLCHTLIVWYKFFELQSNKWFMPITAFHVFAPVNIMLTGALWALGDSNPGPSGYEPDALTN